MERGGELRRAAQWTVKQDLCVCVCVCTGVRGCEGNVIGLKDKQTKYKVESNKKEKEGWSVGCEQRGEQQKEA